MLGGIYGILDQERPEARRGQSDVGNSQVHGHVVII